MSDQSERIGPYRLLRTVGEGGMGVVYEADQLEPVRRRVALKLLRIGMDTKAFIARFEAERQALAVMDHSNIARVLDAGATPDGRPYYVMELVPGVPINEYCDDQRLTTRERLELFLDVCHAVQHAHQKGVIHRDLKPSNVLVATPDGRPTPKVIDFGIAKAIGRPLTDLTLVTEVGRPMGTPAYMSPEQWDASADIDTRADIYSLGVMLYELLTGRLPYDVQRLVLAGPAAPLLLRDTTPLPPSTLVRSLGPAGSTLARARQTDARSLVRDLRGDLDWITLKAMDADRRRRYETPHALALDISRHLRSEPVLARPPSAPYRVGRFLVRHRLGASVAGVLLAAGVAFTATTVTQANRVARERDRAEAEAAKVRALNGFLQETLLSPDPLEGLGRDATVREALDSAVARLGRGASAPPIVEASLKSAIGWAYFRLGDYEKAGPLLRAALTAHESLPSADSVELAESLLRVGQLDAKLARFDSASRRIALGLAMRRRVSGDGSRDVAAALVIAGGFARDRGDTTRAVEALGEARRLYARLGDARGTAAVDNQLGLLEYGRGNLHAAEQYMRGSLDYYKRSLGRHPLVAEGLANLGALLEDLGRPAEAEAAYRESLDIALATLGEEHDIVSAILNNLGVLLSNQRRGADAQRVLRRALAIDERKLGPTNPAVAVDLLNLAQAICRDAPSDEGAAMAARAARLLAASDGPTSWTVGQSRVIRGQCLTGLRRFAEAERELRDGLHALERGLGGAHRRVDSARVRLAELEQLRRRSP